MPGANFKTTYHIHKYNRKQAGKYGIMGLPYMY